MWKSGWPKTLFQLLIRRRNGVLKRKLRTCSSFSQDVSLSESFNNKEKWVFPSRYSDVIIPEQVSFTQYLFDKQEKFANKTALINGETGQTFTHYEIRLLSLRFASALSRLGYCSGDIVAIVSPNCPEFAISFLGLSIVGVVPSTINFSFTKEEIKFQLLNAECVAVVCHEDKLSVVREACKNNNSIRHIISFGPEQDGVLSIHKLFKDDGKGLPSIVKVNQNEDMAVLPYSSGTTGIPKGVMLTHRNLVANLQQIAHPNVTVITSENDFQDVLIGVLPLYHIYGLMIILTSTLSLGGQMVTLKEFNQHTYVDAIKKYKPTILPLVPPLVSFFESSSLVTPRLLENVRAVLCGAAPLGHSLIEKFTAKFGSHINFYEGFGMTEASPATHVTPKGGFEVGSCGVALPNTLTKIVDTETGVTIGPNEGEGELCVKGPQVMKGYFKNEKATRDTIKEDGWLYTGDIARINENENVFITDRLKELIKVKGMQVAPAELENLLRKHPSVNDVAVVGVPDERAGELPRAFVVPSKTGKSVNEEDIKSFVAQKVSPHKRIGSVVFLDEIPKSAAGKILRKNLRNLC